MDYDGYIEKYIIEYGYWSIWVLGVYGYLGYIRLLGGYIWF